ncbi:MAG: hypothetical protein H6835_17005 [Planctomycetes bacterium]|nr:hypothetical protein [Planctomycetota bacterium]
MRLTVSALTLALAATASAQGLLDNLVTSPGGNGSSGTDPFHVIGGKAVFVASGSFGSEPWVTDGTPAGTKLLLDLAPVGSSGPQHLITYGNQVLFTAYVPGLGTELWTTDGTTAGTQLVVDMFPGDGNGQVDYPVLFNGFVYFAANDAVNGAELWRTDGTAAGTTLVADVYPGPISSGPARLAVANGQLWFSANVPNFGRELHRMDAAHVVTRVADQSAGNANTDVLDIRAFGSGVLFSASAGSGYEPYFSDGTAAGTVLLGDLNAGVAHSNPEEFTTLGGVALFSALGTGIGRELYVTDGTPAGTALVRDLRLGAGGSAPEGFTEINGVVVFAATDDVHGREVWVSDGTSGGTDVLIDAYMGIPSSNPVSFVRFGNEVWYGGDTGLLGLGAEIWRTDGTFAGTDIVADLIPGSPGTHPVGLTPFGSQMLFRGSLGGAGTWEPCVTDGTPFGSTLLADVATPAANAAPDQFCALGAEVMFAGNTDSLGRELYVSDGTPGGTGLLIDLQVGGFGSEPQDLCPVGGDVFFRASSTATGWQLFVADGGTQTITQLTSGNGPATEPRAMTQNGNLVIFSGNSSHGREPWVTDGTAAGTFELLDIAPGGSGLLNLQERFVTAGNLTFFTASDGVNGYELWATDGTTAGTAMVRDILPGAGSSSPSDLTAVGNLVYFTAVDGAHGNELWVSDGTLAGTFLALDIVLGPISSFPTKLTEGAGDLYFTASGTSREVMRFDGVTRTTITNTGAGQSDPYTDLTWTNNGLFFLHDDMTGSGVELWVSDGTLAGSHRVTEIAPGRADGPVSGTLVPVLGGTQVMFAASDLQNGMRLWQSDGVATNMLEGFSGEGYGAASVGSFTTIGGITWFACDDGVNGNEPWTYDPATGVLAFVLPYGSPCTGTPGGPTIGANGQPTIGNAGFAVTVANAPPSTLAVLVGSALSGSAPLGAGCEVLIGFPYAMYPAAFVDAAGSAATAVPVPNSPIYVGASLFFQWAVLDAAGPLFGHFDLSAGLQMHMGY